jgi:hypothetical protein
MKHLNRLLLASLTTSQSTGLGKEVHSGFNMEWKYDISKNQVCLQVIIPQNSWFGLTLGTYSMVNSDMIAFQAA